MLHVLRVPPLPERAVVHRRNPAQQAHTLAAQAEVAAAEDIAEVVIAAAAVQAEAQVEVIPAEEDRVGVLLQEADEHADKQNKVANWSPYLLNQS